MAAKAMTGASRPVAEKMTSSAANRAKPARNGTLERWER